MESQITENTNRKNLLQLLWLRLIAAIGQVLVILVTNYFLEIALPLKQMFFVVVALSLVNFTSFLRYKSGKEIGNKTLFVELLFDVFALTAQLYLSGGISNPFISLFLLQVIISAILLQRSYACAIGAITVICYIFLSFHHQELHALHHQMNGDFFSLHLQGMLISYIFAAILLLIFVTKIIKNLNERDRDIFALKQQSFEEEKLVKIALLTTSAAHELSTPLATISVILGDLKIANLPNELLQEVELAETQISRCKKILSNILLSAKSERLEKARAVLAKEYFDSLVKEWSLIKNPKNLTYDFFGDFDKKIILDEALPQVFFNILDNALEESPDLVFLKVEALKNEIVATIKDRGRGFKKDILQKIGEANLTTKNGNGLGLFLAISALRRIGGSLQVKNLEQGAEVIIKFPA